MYFSLLFKNNRMGLERLLFLYLSQAQVLDPMIGKGTTQVSITIATALIALFGTGDEDDRLLLAFSFLRLPEDEENLSGDVLKEFCQAFGNLVRMCCPETTRVSDVQYNGSCSFSDFKLLFSKNQVFLGH